MSFEEFSRLINIASVETSYLSGGCYKNAKIQKIINGANEDTIPFACLFLDKHIHMALAILCALVKKEDQPPIPEYYRGRIPVILACWQYWALKHYYVYCKHNLSVYWVEDKHGNRGDWH